MKLDCFRDVKPGHKACSIQASFLFPAASALADMATLPSAGTSQSSHATRVPMAKDNGWQHDGEQKGFTIKKLLGSVLVWLECQVATCDIYHNPSF